MQTVKAPAPVLASSFAVLLALAAPQGRSAEPADVALYTAEYEVYYDGKHLASAEFAVTKDQASGSYAFTSRTKARAMLRMLRPGAASELSEFRLADGRIEPVAFAYDDGTRQGEDSFAVSYDRAADMAVVTSAGGEARFPLEAGLLDRGSLQIALMYDLGRCREPGAYRLIDDDGIETYSYERLDDRETGTGLGILPTQRYQQRREGSSRTTVLWVAPELAYLPVRIEQIRNGEIETIFALEKLQGISRQPSGC